MQKILACVDGSEFSDSVIREALTLATMQKAEGVEVLHVLEKAGQMPFPSETEGEVTEALGPVLKRVEEKIGEIAAELDRVAVPYVGNVLVGSPYKVILQRLEKGDVDLVVMGHRGLKGMSRFFLGSVAAKVVAYAPCHVLVLRSTKSERPARVMVAIDGGETSADVMAFGLDHALNAGASEVLFLNVIEDLTEIYHAYWGNVTADPDWFKEVSRKARERMAGILGEITSSRNVEGVALKTEVASGWIHATIISVAESEGIDLVVVGDRGKHGFEGFLMGSVSAKIVRYAPCGVLVYRTGFGRD